MKFPTGLALLGFGLLAAGVAGAAEGLSRAFGAELRVPIYAGGCAGILLGLVGIPFAVKLAGIAGAKDESGAFWRWWGLGMLSRLGLMLVLALSLAAAFDKQAMPALLSMVAAYLVGMFAEAGWLAKLFIAGDGNGRV